MNKEKKYLLHNIEGYPHTGNLLKAFFKKRRIHKNALARKLERDISNLVRYQKNASIQTAILWEICLALKHNFFKDIAACLPADFTTDAPITSLPEERISQLEEELKLVSAERDILIKALGK